MLVAGLLYFCCQQNGFSGCLIFFVFGELVGLIESVNCFPYFVFFLICLRMVLSENWIF